MKSLPSQAHSLLREVDNSHIKQVNYIVFGELIISAMKDKKVEKENTKCWGW